MKIFLTGATGFIGQALTTALCRRGWKMTALVRQPDSLPVQTLKKRGVELVQGDITQRESMRSGMSGADIVVHNAGEYEYGMNTTGKTRVRAANILGTENVLSLALELSIPRTVHVSTIQAFGETGPQPRDESFTRQAPCRTTYECSKTEAHKIAQQYLAHGLPLIIACPHQVIGVNDHTPFGYFIRMYINHLLPPMSWSSNSIFCCIQLDDLAEGIALATEKGRIGETYFLCGDPQTFREIFTIWKEKPGGYLPKIWLPTRLAYYMFALLEPFERWAGMPAILSRETVFAGATNWNYCSDKAKRELNWMYRSGEELWLSTIEAEIQLLPRRRSQNLVQRIMPLEVLE